MRCISIVRSLYFRIFSASFLINCYYYYYHHHHHPCHRLSAGYLQLYN
jgi:hypothetical protein